jgi:PBP1b-binding outer membrane lipoprotein LpoB
MRLKSIFALSILLAVGCAKDPSTEVTAAKVSAAQPTPAPSDQRVANEKEVRPTPAAPAVTDIALQGEITFVGSKVTGSHSGRFTNWIGTAQRQHRRANQRSRS